MPVKLSGEFTCTRYGNKMSGRSEMPEGTCIEREPGDEEASLWCIRICIRKNLFLLFLVASQSNWGAKTVFSVQLTCLRLHLDWRIAFQKSHLIFL